MKTILKKILIVLAILFAFIIGLVASGWWSVQNMPDLEYDEEGNVVGIPE